MTSRKPSEDAGVAPPIAGRPHCPHCGQAALIPIFYGLPPSHIFAAQQRGELRLGGCLIDIDSPQPQWHCSQCQRDSVATAG